MSVRVGIVMDPIAGISYKKDSSLAIGSMTMPTRTLMGDFL